MSKAWTAFKTIEIKYEPNIIAYVEIAADITTR